MTHDNLLLLIDEEGRIIRWENSAEELFGWSAAEAVGQSAKALIHTLSPDDAQPRDGHPDPGALLVKPALQDHSLVWRIQAAGDDAISQDMAVLQALFPPPPVELQVFDEKLHAVRTSTLADEQPQLRHPRDAPFSEVCGFAASKKKPRWHAASSKPVCRWETGSSTAHRRRPSSAAASTRSPTCPPRTRAAQSTHW
ncbi:PAS domain-containing protein [Streptomyces sp. 142MFCol3.1]|uniref:PAS domain-containing protein n=1 Tax=Streptomyces sp. 142MFCol3.1 TaxID=1172179 RepID=UPI0009989C21|nr:PAS domain-containing protein [Streptomyces sp. 142MFCol3.1]